MEFDFSEEVLRRALLNIYSRDFHPVTEIEINLFNEIWAKMNKAAKEGFSKSKAITPDEDFRNAILRNNAVFSAFKVHRMQNDMARLLLDSNGILKPFDKWVQEVLPIASHQVRHWLRTEYDTAIIRAHQAADWQQFLRERDVLPNLKWLPSTSIHPGADHRPFWNTIRPIDDPFWNIHRPGDRWNCKCDLTATDEEPTPLPDEDDKNKPHPGLDNNPGTDGKLFSDNHPYQTEAHEGAKKAVDKVMARIDEMIAEMPKSLTREEKMAIARNNLEIEKALQIKKGNLWMWIRRINRMRIPNTWTSIFLILTGYIVIKGETVTGRTAITIKTGYSIQHQLSDLRTGIRFTVKRMGYYSQGQCCRVKT